MSFVEDERGVAAEVAVLRGGTVSRRWRVGGRCRRTARYSLISMPSVMYLITVDGPVQSSKRIVYPTSCPKSHPNSSATRFATLIAATRRGCVQPIMPARSIAVGLRIEKETTPGIVRWTRVV